MLLSRAARLRIGAVRRLLRVDACAAATRAVAPRLRLASQPVRAIGGCPYAAKAAAAKTGAAPAASAAIGFKGKGGVVASGHPAFVNPYANPAPLTAEEIGVIQSTVPVLEQHGLALTTQFYQKMLGKHPELKDIFNSAHQATGAQPKALAAAVGAYAANILNLGALTPAVALMAHKHASLSILPAMYPVVGVNLLETLQELLTGAKFPADTIKAVIAAWAKAYALLADILIREEEQLYQAAAAAPGGWRGWRKFTVARKVVEADGVTSFYLAPSDGAALPTYLPGQYTTVRMAVPATATETANVQPRQYSLSQPSAADARHFRITVKREDAKVEASGTRCPAGRVSTQVHATLDVGREVELAAPFGNFVLSQNTTAPVVLVGAGVGITPLAAMADSAAAAGRPVTFLFACESGARHPFKAWLQAATKRFTAARVWYRTPVAGADVLGRDYDAEGLMDLSAKGVPTLPAATTGADYYVCGPAPFMSAQLKALAARGVPADKVHAEVFSTGGTTGSL